MARKSVKTTNLLGAVPQLVQFITNHSAALTEQGLNPEALKTKLGACCTTVQTTEQSQADAKSALKNATRNHNDMVALRYPEFSNVVDLLRGAVVKGSVLVIDKLASPGQTSRMARKLRVEYPGAVYHVMNRGDRREPIFQDDQDRKRFLETLAECCAKTGWQVHAYCLMPNHFHLVVETPRPNLVDGMKWFMGTYTARFNRRHKSFGHLFSGRYKSLVVDGSGDGYLKTVCDYVHLNPARAELMRPEEPLRSFVWSSWPAYLLAPSKRPVWLRVERLLGEYRIPKDSPAGRQHLEQALEARRGAELGEEFKAIRRGWFLGEETFRKELLAQMSGRIGAEHYGSERTETDAEKAEGIIATELKRRGWTEGTLRERPKGDSTKVKLAERLRAETVRTVEWLAQRLHLGSRAYAHHLLWRARKMKTDNKTPLRQ